MGVEEMGLRWALPRSRVEFVWLEPSPKLNAGGFPCEPIGCGPCCLWLAP